MKKYGLLLCVSWLGLSLLGQSDRYLDKLVLTNGSIIWGITEIQENQIKIFLDQERSIVVPDSSIKSLKTGKLNPELYLKRTPGVYYQISTGVLIGKQHEDFQNIGSFSAQFITGYKFRHYIGAGLGAGVNYYSDERHIPLIVDVQGDLLQSRVTPFYEISTGWSWAEDRRNSTAIDRLEGGFFWRPSVGVRWHFAKYSWQLQFSYVRQHSTTYYEPVDFGNGNVVTNEEDRIMQRFGISVGVGF